MASTRRGVVAILGGTAGAQVIALASAPLISRLFSADQYGPFAVVTAASLPLAAVMALRLDLAIPAVEEEGDSLRVARLGIEAAAALTTGGMLLSWLGRSWLGDWLNLPDPRIVAFIPLIAGVTAIYTVLNQVAIRERRYQAIGRRNLMQGGAVALLQLLAGAIGWGAAGLAVGAAGGQLLGVLSLAASLRDLDWAISGGPRRELLRRFKVYPMLMAPSGLINALGLQAPVILTSIFYGHAVSGWLGMTQRILALPVGLIGLAISQVFLGEFGTARRKGGRDLRSMFSRATRSLTIAAVSMGAVIFAFAPWAFSVVLGDQWRISGLYAQALAAGMVAQMVAAPLSQTLIVLGRVRLQALWDLSRLLLCAGAVWIFHLRRSSPGEAVWALSIATALSYGASWSMSWWAVKKAENGAHG